MLDGEEVLRAVGAMFSGGIVLAALLACTGASDDQLRARSAFDLQCPDSQLKITEIDDKTRGVTGCGQRVTYVESCDGPADSMARECTWVLNSDSRPVEPKKKKKRQGPSNMDGEPAANAED
jgi:hypothetical protein